MFLEANENFNLSLYRSSVFVNGNKDVFFHKTDVINYRKIGTINIDDSCKFKIKNGKYFIIIIITHDQFL